MTTHAETLSSRARSRIMTGIGAGVSLGALVLMSGGAWAATVPPTTIYVSTSGSNQTGTGSVSKPYQTIQYAVSQATQGDTVVVMPGTYSGTVTVNTALTIESTGGSAGGAAHTILNASGSTWGIVVDGAATAGTTITGLTVENASSHGIFAEDTHDVTISNNMILDDGLGLNPAIPEDKGIQLSGVSYSAVINNTVSGSVDGGISVTDDGPIDPGLAQPASGMTLPADGNLIEGNTVIGATHACGILVVSYNAGPNAGVSGNVVMDNTVEHSVAGLVVAADTPHDLVQNNAVVGNNLLDNFISGIIVHSNAPGDVLSGTVVVNNTLAGNGPDPEVGATKPAGIVVAGAVEPVTDTVISNNSVTNEYYGIFLDNGLATSLNNNQVTAAVPVAPGLELYTPMHASPAGVDLSFTADAPAVQAPLYQFWADSAQGWKMVQNYSPNPDFTLPSAAAGSYEVAAFALTPAQLAQGDWKDAVMATTFVNVDSGVTLSVTNGSGSTVATASATNLLNPVYQFWAELPNGEWVSSGGYTSADTYTLPKNAGTSAAAYHVIVYAKDAAAPESATYEVSSQVVTVTESPS